MATEQLTIPGFGPIQPHFDGPTYDAGHDHERLTSQLDAVRGLLMDGEWRTIAQITDAVWKRGVHATTQGISARVRDLRKQRFGAYAVESRRVHGGRGEFEYRIARQA